MNLTLLSILLLKIFVPVFSMSPDTVSSVISVPAKAELPIARNDFGKTRLPDSGQLAKAFALIICSSSGRFTFVSFEQP